MVSKTVCLTLLFTASSCFLLGAYYQHEDAMANITKLIQNDPYAFYIRGKLYGVLRFFKFDADEVLANHEPSRMQEIMKYGFPGLDDIRLYSDFVLSYDRRNRVAHWVCEHLRKPCIQNTTSVRRGMAEFKPDMNVPSNFRVDLTDYNQSGFDRGHLAAAGNHKCSQSQCNETFFMTNIAPQVGKGFNRDAWNNLEIYVRDLTERYGSVYVCTGPLYLPKKQANGKYYVEYEVIGPKTVAVPTHFFKVITIDSKLPGGSPYMEAYVLPNAPIDNNTDIRSFLCDIHDIEHDAGLQFFNGIRRSYFFGMNYTTAPDIFANFK